MGADSSPPLHYDIVNVWLLTWFKVSTAMAFSKGFHSKIPFEVAQVQLRPIAQQSTKTRCSHTSMIENSRSYKVFDMRDLKEITQICSILEIFIPKAIYL